MDTYYSPTMHRTSHVLCAIHTTSIHSAQRVFSCIRSLCSRRVQSVAPSFPLPLLTGTEVDAMAEAAARTFTQDSESVARAAAARICELSDNYYVNG
ncbi:hypothetical protein F2P81_000167 [Scophthalmus maximus]|uniref:Uncharacterized protein n=1 Tax=Scophthalmus maximus TaxID=52904 RepID=A0A6A4TTH7_SCOMX|nr:hypothetical protein F2P81_000167 [Scophthalmus maximus]